MLYSDRYTRIMTQKSGERSAFFPAIEKKYGLPMAYWFDQMKLVEGLKYPEQVSFLRENHGFSQAHANALVMYSRGSTSSKRVSSLDSYLAEFDEPTIAKALEIFNVILKKHPSAHIVIAWNKPMVKLEDQYLFALTIHKQHILLAPWGEHMIDEFADRLVAFETNKKTFKVPLDWKVDKKLILDMVALRLKQLNS